MSATSATCSACGVAVVPGYVRCPKCHRPLPSRRASTGAGGTAVSGGNLRAIAPIVAGGVVVLGVIVWLAVRGGDNQKAQAQPPPTPDETITTESESPATTPTPLPDVTERRPQQPSEP